MADVQLEHGFVKLANRLLEAVIDAPFTDKQRKVLLALIRLTYGWRRKSVQLSEMELAAHSREFNGGSKRAGGQFRVDLKGLIDNGVIVRIETEKRGRFVWALNKNFADWGEFATAPAALESRWGQRPKSSAIDDEAITGEAARVKGRRAGQSEMWPGNGPDDDHQTESDEWPVDGPDNDDDKWTGDGPHENDEWTSNGPHSGPVPGHSSAVSDDSVRLYSAGNTVKDSSTVVSTDSLTNTSNSVVPENDAAAVDKTGTAKAENAQPTDPPSRPSVLGDASAPPSPEQASLTRARPGQPTPLSGGERSYSVELAVAASIAIEKRWGEQPRPLMSGTGDQLAADREATGVPRELACAVIARVLEQTKTLKRPPATLEYFRQPILEAFEDAAERATIDAAKRRAPSAPAPISAVVNADRERERKKREEDELAAYETERRAAAAIWQRDPENKLRFKALFDRVSESKADSPGDNFRTMAITREVIIESATLAGFPDLETWRAKRRGAGAA